MRRLLLSLGLSLSALLAACGGGGDDAPIAPPDVITYSVGGQLAGLGAGKTVVLADASGR